ncbi:MAG: DeoR/GlpR transcriptional regulator [Rubrivivax sp.]|nr:MAG: DeoR/GlpR transcriptional regulator [Rubrivivax sp.]
MPSPRSDVWAPNPRQLSLLDEVRARGAVSVERLAQRLDVTMQTVRRDIQRLTEAGMLDRFNGGVSLPPSTTPRLSPAVAWSERQALKADAKARLARSVVGAVPDGARLMLGIGTTVEAVAQALTARKGLHVITHSLHVAQTLTSHPECTVEVPAGVVRRRDASLEGPAAEACLKQSSADIAIISALGVDLDGHLRDRDERETPAVQAMLGQARECWLVMDASKFLADAPVSCAHLRQVQRVFTEALPPAPLTALMNELGISLTIAP